MKNILIKTFSCILLGLAFSELIKFSFFLMNMSSTIAFFVGVSILLGGTGIMLGYTLNDLDEMVRSVGLAKKSISNEETRINAGLDKAHDFLQGLWAEGYFD